MNTQNSFIQYCNNGSCPRVFNICDLSSGRFKIHEGTYYCCKCYKLLFGKKKLNK